MGVSVSEEWTFRGLQTIILENEWQRIVLLPELGAKIWQVTYKPKDRPLLWNHPRLKPQKLPFHSVYDDVFYGGWDELFPNDMPEELEGEQMPDHGEIWTLPWDYQIDRSCCGKITVHLWVDTPISCCRVEKWISLSENDRRIRFRYKVTNHGRKNLPYLWKLHAAMAVNEHSRIDLGAKEMLVENYGCPRTGETGLSYRWPMAADSAGRTYDMSSVLPESSGCVEFQYATEMAGGWCAVTDTKERVGFGLSFDLNVFPSCWLFASYGGWRNLNTLILEPCSGYPVSLKEGLNNGTHKMMAPGESVECIVTAVIYENMEHVSAIDADGRVFS